MGPALARPGGWVLTPDVFCLPELPRPGEGWSPELPGALAGRGWAGQSQGRKRAPAQPLYSAIYLFIHLAAEFFT